MRPDLRDKMLLKRGDFQTQRRADIDLATQPFRNAQANLALTGTFEGEQRRSRQHRGAGTRLQAQHLSGKRRVNPAKAALPRCRSAGGRSLLQSGFGTGQLLAGDLQLGRDLIVSWAVIASLAHNC